MEPSLETADEESERAKHNEHNKNPASAGHCHGGWQRFCFPTLLCNVDNHGGCIRERCLTTSARHHTMKCSSAPSCQETSTCVPPLKKAGRSRNNSTRQAPPCSGATECFSPLVWRVWVVQPVQAVQEVRTVKIVWVVMIVRKVRAVRVVRAVRKVWAVRVVRIVCLVRIVRVVRAVPIMRESG